MGGSRRPFVEDGCSAPTSGRQVSPVAHACSVRKRRLFSLHDCSSPAPAGTITVAVSAGTAIERLRCSAETRPPPRLRAHAGAGEPGPEPRGDVHERACGLEVRLCTAGHTRAQRRTAPRHCGAGVGSSACGLRVSFAAARTEQQQEEEDEAGERRRRPAPAAKPRGGRREEACGHAALPPTFGRPERD